MIARIIATLGGRHGLGLTLALVATGLALPQDSRPAPTTRTQEEKTAKPQDEKAPRRDPFRKVTPESEKPAEETVKKEPVFRAAENGAAIPRITLRGYVEPGGAEATPIAMIEIDGQGVYIVRAGDSISLQGEGNTRLSLNVRRISRQQVEVVGGTLEEVIIVR